MKKHLLLIFISITLSSSIKAGFSPGEGATASEFLKIPVSARPLALGGSYTASFGDVSSLEYNPAGLAGIYRTELSASYQLFFEDTSLASLSYATPFTLGSSMSKLNDGAPFIPRDKVFFGLHYRILNTNDTARSDLGGKLNDFSIRDQAIQAGLAYAPKDQFTLGFSGKMINRKIDNESVNSFAFDAGLLFFAKDNLTFGASLLNYGSDQTFVNEADPMPTSLRLGTKWRPLSRLSILADAARGRDSVNQFSTGLEYDVAPIFHLRAGALNQNDVEFTAGFGIDFVPRSNTTPGKIERSDPEKKVLADIDNMATRKEDSSNSPSPLRQMAAGLDYAARFNTYLGVTHIFTLRLLF